MRIGICGTHCAGKTTLAKFIAERDGYELIADVAGDFINREQGSVQLDIAKAQMVRERLAGDNFVSDRTVFDNIAYQYEIDPSLYMNLSAEYKEHLMEHPYDLIVFVDEYFPIEDAPHRSNSEVQQKWIYNFLRDNLSQFTLGYQIPYCVVFGPTEQRYEMICDFLHTTLKYTYECD